MKYLIFILLLLGCNSKQKTKESVHVIEFDLNDLVRKQDSLFKIDNDRPFTEIGDMETGAQYFIVSDSVNVVVEAIRYNHDNKPDTLIVYDSLRAIKTLMEQLKKCMTKEEIKYKY